MSESAGSVIRIEELQEEVRRRREALLAPGSIMKGERLCLE
jgi:hypothetical protein